MCVVLSYCHWSSLSPCQQRVLHWPFSGDGIGLILPLVNFSLASLCFILTSEALVLIYRVLLMHSIYRQFGVRTCFPFVLILLCYSHLQSPECVPFGWHFPLAPQGGCAEMKNCVPGEFALFPQAPDAFRFLLCFRLGMIS